MRILLIGATGTIGRAVAEALAARHEIVPASHGPATVTAARCSAKARSLSTSVCPRKAGAINR